MMTIKMYFYNGFEGFLNKKERLKVGFILANMFDITALYELKAADIQKTTFSYTVTNRALKWFIIPFLWFASDKVVVNFLERVKKVAENEYK